MLSGCGGGGRRRGVSGGELLRPPGAGGARRLLARCIKCGRCAEICPYRTIRLAPWSSGASYGTPYIEPTRQPCHLCMKCPGVCPTGALRPVRAERVRMGTAVILRERCLSWHSTICNQCYESCPYKDHAIELDALLRPVIVADACVGCGKCTFVCPVTPRAVLIRPRGDS